MQKVETLRRFDNSNQTSALLNWLWYTHYWTRYSASFRSEMKFVLKLFVVTLMSRVFCEWSSSFWIISDMFIRWMSVSRLLVIFELNHVEKYSNLNKSVAHVSMLTSTTVIRCATQICQITYKVVVAKTHHELCYDIWTESHNERNSPMGKNRLAFYCSGSLLGLDSLKLRFIQNLIALRFTAPLHSIAFQNKHWFNQVFEQIICTHFSPGVPNLIESFP